MKEYEVVFYLDVRAICRVEAESPDEALEIAGTADWDYTDEEIYEHTIYECDSDGNPANQVYTKRKELRP